MNKKNNLFINLSMFVSVLMIFFGNFIANLYILQSISCALAILSSLKQKKKVKIDSLIWLMACLVALFSVLISGDRITTLEIAVMINLVVIIKIIYENNKSNWQERLLKMFTIASGIHVFATITQLIIPNIITSFNSAFMGANNFSINQDFLKRGTYAGITAQTSVNAYFISIFIGIVFSKIITKSGSKKLNVFLLIIAFIALFITGKRGLLLFTIISIALIFLYNIRKDKKHFIKNCFLIVTIFSIGYITLLNVPATKVVFEKFENLEKTDNLLNGREFLWEKSLEEFKNNPLFGIGQGRIDGIYGDGSHNIYIQLLAETGVIGFSIYVLAILFSLFKTIKKAKLIFNNDNDSNNKKIILLSLFVQFLFITYGFTGNPLYSNIFLTPYIISIAMANGLNVEEREEKNEKNWNTNIS